MGSPNLFSTACTQAIRQRSNQLIGQQLTTQMFQTCGATWDACREQPSPQLALFSSFNGDGNSVVVSLSRMDSPLCVSHLRCLCTHYGFLCTAVCHFHAFS